jgi:hypothetical protein
VAAHPAQGFFKPRWAAAAGLLAWARGWLGQAGQLGQLGLVVGRGACRCACGRGG